MVFDVVLGVIIAWLLIGLAPALLGGAFYVLRKLLGPPIGGFLRLYSFLMPGDWVFVVVTFGFIFYVLAII